MRWIVAVSLGALALLIIFFPLSAATSRLAPGLEADSVSGSIWKGRLRNARYAGLPLGDIDVGLDAGRLLQGEASLKFERLGPRLRGRAGGTRADRRLEGLTGDLPLQILPPPAPALLIRFEGAYVTLSPRGACRSAGGRISTELTGIPLLGDTPPLAGSPSCDADRLFAPLRDAGGRAGLDLWLAGDGAWTANIRLVSESQIALFALAALGFAIDGPVASLSVRGTVDGRDMQFATEFEPA